jgi:hypothetical protein
MATAEPLTIEPMPWPGERFNPSAATPTTSFGCTPASPGPGRGTQEHIAKRLPMPTVFQSTTPLQTSQAPRPTKMLGHTTTDKSSSTRISFQTETSVASHMSVKTSAVPFLSTRPSATTNPSTATNAPTAAEMREETGDKTERGCCYHCQKLLWLFFSMLGSCATVGCCCCFYGSESSCLS